MRKWSRDRSDGTSKEIVSFLRAHGVEVIETERPLDCLISNGGQAGWIEIKTAARNADIKRTQLEFMANTKMPVALVKTPDEALQFAQRFDGLTQRQKDNIAVFLRDATKTKYHPAVIERILKWE